MKSKIYLCLILSILFLLNPIYGRIQNVNNIVGVWLTNKKDSKIKIFKNTDGTFTGKIIWAQTPHESFEGIEVIKGMTYNVANNTYICPWIYSPKMKVTAHAIVYLDGGTLNVKIKKGIVSITEVFTKVE